MRVGHSWDDEYRKGRSAHEEPVRFVEEIVAAGRRDRVAGEVGLYIGCGNGRNYTPLVDAGLNLVGIDITPDVIAQLKARGRTARTA